MFRPGNTPSAHAQISYDPTLQTPALLYDEARTVHLGNLARRDNGVPPLRWNRHNGLFQIVSNVPIVAAERVSYKVNNVNTSFTEMMAPPNAHLDTQLRFRVP